MRSEEIIRTPDQLDYVRLLGKLGPAPSIKEVSQFLGVSSGYVSDLISRGRLQTYEISYEYGPKDPRRKKRIVLNTVFEFLQGSQEARRGRGVAAAINSLSPEDDPDTQRC
jgi:hypothetical protein